MLRYCFRVRAIGKPDSTGAVTSVAFAESNCPLWLPLPTLLGRRHCPSRSTTQPHRGHQSCCVCSLLHMAVIQRQCGTYSNHPSLSSPMHSLSSPPNELLSSPLPQHFISHRPSMLPSLSSPPYPFSLITPSMSFSHHLPHLLSSPPCPISLITTNLLCERI